MKKLYLYFLKYYGLFRDRSEDKTVLKFLKNHDSDNVSYLEIGSGLGRFVRLVSNSFSYNLTALEINPELAARTEKMGIKTETTNFLENKFSDNQFDVVHCSHVIEHVAYPDIIHFLDEMLRITKPKGYVIIRSPLMTADFFTCIDHIRPYPPKAILDYFSNPQQQVTGKYSVEAKKIKLRYAPITICPYSYSPIVRAINSFFKLLWCWFRIHGKADGYVMILQKNN